MNKLPAPNHSENSEIPRISLNHMFQDTLSVLNLDRGIFYTLWQLTIKPGKTLRNYLFADRRKYVHPLRFLFLSAAIAAFINTQFITTKGSLDQAVLENMHVNTETNNPEAELKEPIEVNIDTDNDGIADTKKKITLEEIQKSIASFVLDFINRYFSLLLILFVPILSLCSWIFFRKSKFFYGEHLAINAFYMGYMNVIYILITPFLIWGDAGQLVMFVYLLLGVFFQYFIYARVFQRNLWNTLLNGTIAIGIAYVLYVVVALGFFIILLNRFIDQMGL